MEKLAARGGWLYVFYLPKVEDIIALFFHPNLFLPASG
jgi:hypothetical protein